MDARVSQNANQSQASRWFRGPRSLAVRLAVLYGAIFTLASALLLGIVSFTTIASLKQQRDEAISSELQDLRSEMAEEGGISEVMHEIRERADEVAKSQFIYAVFDKGGRFLVGTNLHIPHAEGWSQAQSAAGPGQTTVHTVRVRSAILPGDYLLAVGEDTDRIDDINAFLVSAFVIGLGVMALLAIAGGVVLSSTFGRRLDRVAAVCTAIMDGDLSLRVPARHSGDEIDLLASSVNAMLDRIVALMDTLKQVSIDIAHDLRTPLTRLRQRLETTETSAKTTSDYSTAVRGAIGQVDSILGTFEALLRIAEIEDGALRSGFVRVNLSAVLQNVADAYAPPAEESGHRIVSHIPGDVAVLGDENLLTQLFANLIANALRHTPKGTTIWIELSAPSETRKVTIADNGPGIPAADRQRVFQRFVRLERSRTTPGNGLGLSLCAAIAQLHNVHIELSDNRPGLRCELTFGA